jgi:opacity protein-like surface antigen
MYVKRVLTGATFVVAMSVAISAQAATAYIEGQVGYAGPNNVDTNTYSGTSGGITATNLKGTLDYKSDYMVGAEFGFKDVLVPNFRVGVSYSTVKFDLNKAVISGSVTNGTNTITGPITASAADFASVGVNLDNRINLYMLNAYYDFKNSTDFTPFVGIGIGFADISHAKDNEFAYSINAGGKYYVDKNFYLGIKAAYTRINGPTDELGVKYDDISATSGHILAGYDF